MPKIYMVEVGVEIDKKEDEYENYLININGLDRHLYDENVVAFFNKKKALDFINKYIDMGVKNTYGVLWNVNRKLDDYEMDEVVNQGYLEDEFLPRKIDNVYFKGGFVNA
jgi:hypothetical protein